MVDIIDESLGEEVAEAAGRKTKLPQSCPNKKQGCLCYGQSRLACGRGNGQWKRFSLPRIIVNVQDFPRLGKLSLPTVNEPTDLLQCGALEYYDKIFDRFVFVPPEQSFSGFHSCFSGLMLRMNDLCSALTGSSTL